MQASGAGRRCRGAGPLAALPGHEVPTCRPRRDGARRGRQTSARAPGTLEGQRPWPPGRMAGQARPEGAVAPGMRDGLGSSCLFASRLLGHVREHRAAARQARAAAASLVERWEMRAGRAATGGTDRAQRPMSAASSGAWRCDHGRRGTWGDRSGGMHPEPKPRTGRGAGPGSRSRATGGAAAIPLLSGPRVGARSRAAPLFQNVAMNGTSNSSAVPFC